MFNKNLKPELSTALSNCTEIITGYMVITCGEEIKENSELKKKLGLDAPGLQDKLLPVLSDQWAKGQKENTVPRNNQLTQYIRSCLANLTLFADALNYSKKAAIEEIPELRNSIIVFQQFVNGALSENAELQKELSIFKEKEKGVYDALLRELDLFQSEHKVENSNSSVKP